MGLFSLKSKTMFCQSSNLRRSASTKGRKEITMNSEGKVILNIQDLINLRAIMLFLLKVLKNIKSMIDNKKKEANLAGIIQDIKDSIKPKM